MNTLFNRICLLLALLFMLTSWGEKAHRKINTSCVNYLPSELNALKTWASQLGEHASDADNRKKEDKNEFVRHFIDIDNYELFLQQKKINPSFQVQSQIHGRAFVLKNGTLPWVTDSTYRALVSNMRSGQWEQAVITAADLGHYVGDGHMPLHITANYNGQLSDQKGIHSRYEAEMIDRYIDSIVLKKGHVKRVHDVQATVFDYLYKNYAYLSPLLQADRDSYSRANEQYDEIYYVSLWKDTGAFTTHLLSLASKTLASFIYSAWIDAGKPEIPVKRKEKQRKMKKVPA